MSRSRILWMIVWVFGLWDTSYSQNTTCDCKTDLVFLNDQVRKTPAYKVNKEAYEETYAHLLKTVAGPTTLYDCYLALSSLLLSLNDNHSKVYSKDKGLTEENKNNLDQLSGSKLYNAFPKPGIDPDSLQAALKTKAKEDIEGIYTRENYLTLGVFRNAGEDNYKAIVLNSETDVWQKGEIAYTLIPFGEDLLMSVGGSLSSKRLISYTERIDDGLFHFIGFKKDDLEMNYASEVLSEETYYRTELSDDITYLQIGSFNSWNPTLSEAERFYESLKGSLTKNNVILDLRNNGGGGDRNSDVLLKIIRKYARDNRVFVLVNHRTASNAEQFTYKLSKLKNSTILGQRTNGSLAYEVTEGSVDLPCDNFIAVLTSKKHPDYLEFESRGIDPDVHLNLEIDWITQLKNHIEKNSAD